MLYCYVEDKRLTVDVMNPFWEFDLGVTIGYLAVVGSVLFWGMYDSQKK